MNIISIVTLPSQLAARTSPPSVAVRLFPACACAREGLCVLTHDRDVVLDQEQGFLAALHQHGQSVAVPLSVQMHPVYAHDSVSGLQRALSEEEEEEEGGGGREGDGGGKTNAERAAQDALTQAAVTVNH